jgi:hypothetical protein
MLSVGIKNGNGVEARVTSRGELVVAPLGFSEARFNLLAVINTAYNFTQPKASQRFCITGICMYADKNVAAGDATVNIYEATSSTSTAAVKTLFSFEMPKQTTRDIIGLNLLVSEGVWLNATTNDNNIFITILGHYIDA